MIRSLLILLLLCVNAAAAQFLPFEQTGIDRRPDAVIPLDLSFVDQNGRSVTLREIADGKPLLLVPVLHKCPNICGVTLSGLAQAVETQNLTAGQDFEWVSFGIDPREGPTEAAASVSELVARFPELRGDRVHALTGTAGNVRSVTDSLGYRYAWDDSINQYAHVAATAAITTDGHIARWLYGVAPTPDDIKLALVEAGQGRTGAWTDQLLLLCYHYDPQTGTYGSIVWTMLRIGGGATVGAGLLLIGLALRRERRRARLAS